MAIPSFPGTTTLAPVCSLPPVQDSGAGQLGAVGICSFLRPSYSSNSHTAAHTALLCLGMIACPSLTGPCGHSSRSRLLSPPAPRWLHELSAQVRTVESVPFCCCRLHLHTMLQYNWLHTSYLITNCQLKCSSVIVSWTKVSKTCVVIF